MEILVLQLVSLFSTSLYLNIAEAQFVITHAPVNKTSPLHTNISFTCRGNGYIFWEINNTQIVEDSVVSLLAAEKVYAPLPMNNFSELVMTATKQNNGTSKIECIVGSETLPKNKSEAVYLLVYAEPHTPRDLNVTVDGLNLIATWSEPFSLKGEELSYVIFITNTASEAQKEFTVNTSRFILTEALIERDCAEYQFMIFSENDYSRSRTNINGWKHIPTAPLVTRQSDIWIDVSLVMDVQVVISFNPRDPCPSYPVTNYFFNISDDNNFTVATIGHFGNTSVTINGSSHGIVHNHVYWLVIEAANDVGKTHSEKIRLYTTGLQSSIAVVELNGSITVTCMFATGASSTGCQIIILEKINDTALQNLDSFNISRHDEATKVKRNYEVNGLMDYSMLVVQAVELLSGEVGNITITGTVSLAVVTTPHAPTSPPIQVHPEVATDITIAVVVSIIFLLLVLIIVTICVIITLVKRRKGQSSSLQSTHDNKYVKPLLTEPAYETINPCQGASVCTQTINNPVYSSDVGYAEVHKTSKAHSHRASNEAQNSKSTVTVTASLSAQVSGGELVSLVPSPYLMPLQSQGKERTNREQYEMLARNVEPGYQQLNDPKKPGGRKNEQSTDYINTHDIVVPTDPLTGYSTLLRPEKAQLASSAICPVSHLYESITVKEKCVLVESKDDKVISEMNEIPSPDDKTQTISTLHITSHTNNPPISSAPMISSDSIRPCAAQFAQPELTVSTTALGPIDDPETGYSTLRPDKVPGQPSGPVPLYDTIKLINSVSLGQSCNAHTSQTNNNIRA